MSKSAIRKYNKKVIDTYPCFAWRQPSQCRRRPCCSPSAQIPTLCQIHQRGDWFSSPRWHCCWWPSPPLLEPVLELTMGSPTRCSSLWGREWGNEVKPWQLTSGWGRVDRLAVIGGAISVVWLFKLPPSWSQVLPLPYEAYWMCPRWRLPSSSPPWWWTIYMKRIGVS